MMQYVYSRQSSTKKLIPIKYCPGCGKCRNYLRDISLQKILLKSVKLNQKQKLYIIKNLYDNDPLTKIRKIA